MIELIPLADIDAALVEALLDAAFGEDRKERTAYKIREGTEALPLLSFAAVDMEAKELLGSIQAWPVALTSPDGKKHPLIMVGPVAVHPQAQKEGIGKALMHALLTAQPEEERLPLFLIGDPEYYDRFFGFKATATGGWEAPGPCEAERLLAIIPDGSDLPAAGKLGPWPV